MKKRPKNIKQLRQLRRQRHARKKLNGTASIPRVSVHRSLKHFYAQIIDDEASQTLVGLGTMSQDISQSLKSGGSVTAAQTLGQKVAEKAQEKGIKKVIFDRSGYRYHGRVKAFANALRSHGLDF